jgi:hypothetical protein
MHSRSLELESQSLKSLHRNVKLVHLVYSAEFKLSLAELSQ